MPKTILLADDSVTIQKVVGISFANEDVVLLTVDNGDDAVAQARERRPDLILADIAMPGLDGYAVCEAVKGDASLRHVPVLLLSGTFETFDEARARQVGADGHITKPFEAQALVDRVNDLLARAEADRPVGGAETTVLVSEAPTTGDAFEFFDDELATTAPPVAPASAHDADPLSQPLGAATVLLDADDDPIPLEPVAADPLDLEDAGATAYQPASEPFAVARFEEDPMRADGATILFDDEPSIAPVEEAIAFSPPPVPTPAEVAFGTTLSSKTPLVSAPPDDGATRLIDTDPGDALDFGFEAEPAEPAARDTAAFDPSDDSDPMDDLFATAEEDAPVAAPAPPPVPVAARTEITSGSSAHLDALRGELREHLEKVAWEAFGDLSERIVRETVARVEAVAWEVIPQMAEALIQEEIRKLQSEE